MSPAIPGLVHNVTRSQSQLEGWLAASKPWESQGFPRRLQKLYLNLKGYVKEWLSGPCLAGLGLFFSILNFLGGSGSRPNSLL